MALPKISKSHPESEHLEKLARMLREIDELQAQESADAGPERQPDPPSNSRDRSRT